MRIDLIGFRKVKFVWFASSLLFCCECFSRSISTNYTHRNKQMAHWNWFREL